MSLSSVTEYLRVAKAEDQKEGRYMSTFDTERIAATPLPLSAALVEHDKYFCNNYYSETPTALPYWKHEIKGDSAWMLRAAKWMNSIDFNPRYGYTDSPDYIIPSRMRTPNSVGTQNDKDLVENIIPKPEPKRPSKKPVPMKFLKFTNSQERNGLSRTGKPKSAISADVLLKDLRTKRLKSIAPQLWNSLILKKSIAKKYASHLRKEFISKYGHKLPSSLETIERKFKPLLEDFRTIVRDDFDRYASRFTVRKSDYNMDLVRQAKKLEVKVSRVKNIIKRSKRSRQKLRDDKFDWMRFQGAILSRSSSSEPKDGDLVVDVPDDPSFFRKVLEFFYNIGKTTATAIFHFFTDTLPSFFRYVKRGGKKVLDSIVSALNIAANVDTIMGWAVSIGIVSLGVLAVWLATQSWPMALIGFVIIACISLTDTNEYIVYLFVILFMLARLYVILKPVFHSLVHRITRTFVIEHPDGSRETTRRWPKDEYILCHDGVFRLPAYAKQYKPVPREALEPQSVWFVQTQSEPGAPVMITLTDQFFDGWVLCDDGILRPGSYPNVDKLAVKPHTSTNPEHCPDAMQYQGLIDTVKDWSEKSGFSQYMPTARELVTTFALLNGASNFAEKTARAGSKVVDWISIMITGAPFFHEDHAKYSRAKEYAERAELVMQAFADSKTIATANQVIRTYQDCSKFFVESVGRDVKSYMIPFVDRFKRLETVQIDARAVLISNIPQVQPVGVMFIGEPGTGKGIFATQRLPRALLEAFGIEFTEVNDYIYQVPTGVDNRFIGDRVYGQPFFYMDDLGRNTDPEVTTRDVNNLCSFLDSTPQPLQSSSVSEKGTVFARCKLVIVTTNVTDVFGSGNIHIADPRALYRRVLVYRIVSAKVHDSSKPTGLVFERLTISGDKSRGHEYVVSDINLSEEDVVKQILLKYKQHSESFNHLSRVGLLPPGPLREDIQQRYAKEKDREVSSFAQDARNLDFRELARVLRDSFISVGVFGRHRNQSNPGSAMPDLGNGLIHLIPPQSDPDEVPYNPDLDLSSPTEFPTITESLEKKTKPKRDIPDFMKYIRSQSKVKTRSDTVRYFIGYTKYFHEKDAPLFHQYSGRDNVMNTDIHDFEVPWFQDIVDHLLSVPAFKRSTEYVTWCSNNFGRETYFGINLISAAVGVCDNPGYVHPWVVLNGCLFRMSQTGYVYPSDSFQKHLGEPNAVFRFGDSWYRASAAVLRAINKSRIQYPENPQIFYRFRYYDVDDLGKFYETEGIDITFSCSPYRPIFNYMKKIMEDEEDDFGSVQTPFFKCLMKPHAAKVIAALGVAATFGAAAVGVALLLRDATSDAPQSPPETPVENQSEFVRRTDPRPKVVKRERRRRNQGAEDNIVSYYQNMASIGVNIHGQDRVCKCLLLSDRWIVANKHMFAHDIQDNSNNVYRPDRILITRTGTQVTRVELNKSTDFCDYELSVMEDCDIVLIYISNPKKILKGIRSIEDRIISEDHAFVRYGDEKDSPLILPELVMLLDRTNDSIPGDRQVTRVPIFSTIAELGDLLVRCKANVRTRSGDCGSLYVCSSNRQPQSGKIYGIHASIYSDGDLGFVPFCIEDIQFLKDSILPPSRVNQALIAKGALVPIYELSKHEGNHIPTKNSIVPSLLHGSFGPPTKFPSILVADDRGSPLENALMAFDSPQVELLPQGYPDLIMGYLRSRYPPPAHRECTDVIIYRDNRMLRTSASGFPYRVLHLFSKGDLFTVTRDQYGNYVSHKYEEGFSKDLHLIAKAIQEGRAEISGFYPEGSLKCEILPLRKIEERKTRLFYVGSAVWYVIMHVFYAPLLDAFKSEADSGISSVGLDVHSDDWSRLWKRFYRSPNNVKCSDFKYFDKSHLKEFERIGDRADIDWYHTYFGSHVDVTIDGVKYSWKVDYVVPFFSSVASAPFIVGRYVYDTTNPLRSRCVSGVLTTWFQNMKQNVSLHCAFWISCYEQVYSKKPTVKKLLEIGDITTHGDDVVDVILDDRVARAATPKRFAEFALKYGFTLTSAHKDRELTDDYDPPELWTYLKRRPVIVNGYLRAQRDISDIIQSLYWRDSKSPLSPVDHILSSVDSALLDFHHYGRDVYIEWCQKFDVELRKRGVVHNFKSYQVIFDSKELRLWRLPLELVDKY